MENSLIRLAADRWGIRWRLLSYVISKADTILVQPHVIIPLPVSRFSGIGLGSIGDISKPWIADGRSWHLDQRCSPKTKEILLKLDDIIRDEFDAFSRAGQG